MQMFVTEFLLVLALFSDASSIPTGSSVDEFLNRHDLSPTSAAQVDARCDAAEALARRIMADLAVRSGPATMARDFADIDNAHALAGDTSGQMVIVSHVNVDAAVRDAAQKCATRMLAVDAEINLSQPIYRRLAAIPRDGLDEKTNYMLDRLLRGYRLAGVDRDAGTRAKITALQNKINEAGMEFERNIDDDNREVTFESADALAGLPQDYLDAHPPQADGRIHITTDMPDLVPVLQFADRQATRKSLYLAFVNKGWPKNDAVLARMLERREALAHLLGFPDFATYATVDKMIETPARAWAFLDEIDRSGSAAAQADIAARLARMRQRDPAISSFDLWDSAYATQLLIKENYGVDAEVVRKYFTLDKVRAGIFGLVRDLFGADIRPWRTQTWAPGVTAWELYDQDRLVGRFYLDLSPRDGKYGHAETAPLVAGVAGRRVPVAALVCNFPAKGPMSHGDATVFLHEFGHLIHEIYAGKQLYWAQSIDSMQWDFVEAPSQLLEEWAWDYDTLRNFATNDDGVPISRELVTRLNRARASGQAVASQWQLALSAGALGLHANGAATDLDGNWRKLVDRYLLAPEPAEMHSYDSFRHLNTYSAIYYTYVWSKAIALDLFTRFEAAGLRDPETAMAYRRAVLEPGGSLPADRLIRDFLGRPSNTRAFRKMLETTAAPTGAGK